MSNRHIPVRILTIVLILTLLPGLALSAGIKERMKSRIPAIKALKTQGIIGENNHGYLEFRGPVTQKDLIDAENADRRMVYQAIANKQGASLALVEQVRAKQIAEKEPPGVWVQLPSGEWNKQ